MGSGCTGTSGVCPEFTVTGRLVPLPCRASLHRRYPERTSSTARRGSSRRFTTAGGRRPGAPDPIGRLGCGELRLETGRGAERYYIEGGFVEVLNDRVSLLTERAIPAASLSELEAGEAVKAARGKPARSPEQMAIRDRAVDQARAQLRIARRNPK